MNKITRIQVTTNGVYSLESLVEPLATHVALNYLDLDYVINLNTELFNQQERGYLKFHVTGLTENGESEEVVDMIFASEHNELVKAVKDLPPRGPSQVLRLREVPLVEGKSNEDILERCYQAIKEVFED